MAINSSNVAASVPSPPSAAIPNDTRKTKVFPASKVSDDTRPIPASSSPFVEWETVPSNPSYEVSNAGQVRRAKRGQHTRVGHIMRTHLDKNGYERVCLFTNGRKTVRLVHQLVAEAFIGERPTGWTVNHIDADKQNNHATNIEYLERGDNIRHAHGMGLYPRGEQHASAKLTEDDVVAIKRLLPHHSNCELARRYGVSDVAIRKIRVGKTWAHV